MVSTNNNQVGTHGPIHFRMLNVQLCHKSLSLIIDLHYRPKHEFVATQRCQKLQLAGMQTVRNEAIRYYNVTFYDLKRPIVSKNSFLICIDSTLNGFRVTLRKIRLFFKNVSLASFAK